MQHTTQVEILKLLISRIDSKTTEDAGQILAMPAASYTDESLAANEWRAMFQRHPQILGMSGELPSPGS